jgi:hypothetical protein
MWLSAQSSRFRPSDRDLLRAPAFPREPNSGAPRLDFSPHRIRETSTGERAAPPGQDKLIFDAATAKKICSFLSPSYRNMNGPPFTGILLGMMVMTAGCSAPGTGSGATGSIATTTIRPAEATRPDVLSFGQAGRFEVGAVEELVLHDAKRAKDLPLRVTYPRGGDRHPLIVWSHGAGGSKDNYQPIVTHWASHGYVDSANAQRFSRLA